MKKIFTVLLLIFYACQLMAQSSAELAKINSKRIEFSPSLSAEGNYIVFQSDKDASELEEESQWKLYSSFLQEDSTWSAPEPLSNINDNVAFVAGPSLSYDGNTLYFTAFIEGVTETEDIFYSQRVGDVWGKPIPVGDPVNTMAGFEGFPSISADGKALYFIKVNEDNPWDKKSKENCFTIFVTHQEENGSWQVPQKLPENINMGCERSPRILADNKTLIFSSIREGGEGSFDLYQTTFINENEWSEPISLDYLNTKESDLSPSIPASGDVVYYNAAGDIVKAIVPENFRQALNITVNGFLTNKVNSEVLKGAVEVINSEGEVISTHHSNESTGRYSLVLQTGEKYQLKYLADNYEPVTREIDLTNVKQYEEREENAALEQFYNLTLKVEDAEVKSNFPATIKLLNGEEISSSIEAENNIASIKLPVGIKYQLITEAKNYINDTLIVDLTSEPSKFSEEKTVALNPIKVPVSISLSNMGDRSSRKVRVQNERTGEIIEADANQVLLLRSGDRYKVIVNSEKGYAFASDEIDLTNYDSKSQVSSSLNASVKEGGAVADIVPQVKIDIPMTKLEKGTQITMESILFETNSADLDESSFNEINQLVEMMNKNPELKIQIAAHTDDVGSDAANLSLSQQRAQTVADYLLGKGISNDRFTPKGYGEAKPRVPNDSPENRSKNRRVEFIIM